MHSWFESKIRYKKMMENGKEKTVSEPYLLDALSFTETEARTIEELTPFITGEFTITDIKRAGYSEVFMFEEGGDHWFKAKLVFITLDEKSNIEKKTSTQVLVQANDLQQAKDRIVERMKGTMADYEIDKVAKTEIMDVYPYRVEADEKSDNKQ